MLTYSYWTSSLTNHSFLNLTATFLQYLCSKTGSYEGGSAGGASPAAHGDPDAFIQLVLRQDYMQRSLERTRQSWTQTQIQ